MAISRNFLIFRSVAFAIVTKLSGAAMVFVALPIIAHTTPSADYEAFLKAMNVAAIVGLIFVPFATLTTRELSHAFLGKQVDLDHAIQNTFGMQLAVAATLFGILTCAVLLYSRFTETDSAMTIGITLTLLQMAASWADAYRVANRTDYITNVIQTVANVALVSLLLIVTQRPVSVQTICFLYFGFPALSQAILLLQLLIMKRIQLRLKLMPIKVFWKRLREAFSLTLIPAVDYMKIYLSSMIVLFIGVSNDYILFYTSIIYIARLINPLTLITRPLMPAYIDALVRGDIQWLTGLKKALIAVAAGGALLALAPPFLLTPRIVSIALPPEIHGVSLLYLILCTLFGYGHSLVSLLAPLYVGGHRASFYGFCNFAFTATAIAIGAFFCILHGAVAMMASLSFATTACAIFLLVNFVSRS